MLSLSVYINIRWGGGLPSFIGVSTGSTQFQCVLLPHLLCTVTTPGGFTAVRLKLHRTSYNNQVVFFVLFCFVFGKINKLVVKSMHFFGHTNLA